MKRIRLALILLISLSMLLLTFGCRVDYPYPFDQSFDNIEKVSLHRVEEDHPHGWYAETSWLEDIELESAKEMLGKLEQLKVREHFGDHITTFGYFVLFVLYQDGTTEVIGAPNCATIDQDGNWTLKNLYFSYEEWTAVVSQYVETDLTAEL